MTQVLDIKGLESAELAEMADLARDSMTKPGVPVDIPRSVFTRLENALQAVMADQLLSIREKERSPSPDALKMSFR